MEIEQLRKKRRELEKHIQNEVSNLVEDFKKNTGFSPRSIYIDMENVTTMGDEEPQFIVGKCRVEIDL